MMQDICYKCNSPATRTRGEELLCEVCRPICEMSGDIYPIWMIPKPKCDFCDDPARYRDDIDDWSFEIIGANFCIPCYRQRDVIKGERQAQLDSQRALYITSLNQQFDQKVAELAGSEVEMIPCKAMNNYAAGYRSNRSRKQILDAGIFHITKVDKRWKISKQHILLFENLQMSPYFAIADPRKSTASSRRALREARIEAAADESDNNQIAS